MEFRVTGGGWVSAAGFGRMSQARGVSFPAGPPVHLPTREIFNQRLARWGRYDDYTRCGLAAMALALRDADLELDEPSRPIGIVSASTLECLATDLAYYLTALEAGGSLASPNLFSYTLPGIMLGEAAILFRLSGPTLCVGEEGGRGMTALAAALRLMAGGAAQTMLAGWTDCFAAEGCAPAAAMGIAAPIQGAAFVALDARAPAAKAGGKSLLFETGPAGAEIRTPSGRKIESLFELFEMGL
jgi:3-oxoacyl-[acyl-carrier-protein] synthase II